jgi:copper chaperone CopZ
MKNQNSKVYKLSGMHCPNCAMLIESDLEDAGIKAKVSYAKQTLEIEEVKNIEKISKIVTDSGYKIEEY